MSKRLALLVSLVAVLVLSADAQIRPRIGTTAGVVPVPQVGMKILAPVTADTGNTRTHSVATTGATVNFGFSGIASGAAPLEISYDCVGCAGSFSLGFTPIDVPWDNSIDLNCAVSPGTLNTITVTVNDGAAQVAWAALAITCIIAAGSPTVTIDSDGGSGAGANYTTTSNTAHLEGPCIDDVGCITTGWICTTCQNGAGADPDQITVLKVSPFTRTFRFHHDVPLGIGANVITIAALDEQANRHTDTITVTYAPPLGIATAALAHAKVSTAYVTQDIRATGGSSVYTNWALTAGALPTGMTATQTTVSGVNVFRIAGTPTGAAGDYTFTARVQDSALTQFSRAFTFNLTTGTLEGPHDYFTAQVAAGGLIGGTEDIGFSGAWDEGSCLTGGPTVTKGAWGLRDRNGSQSGNNLIRCVSRGRSEPNTTMTYDYSGDAYVDKQDGAKISFAVTKTEPVVTISGCNATTDICTTVGPHKIEHGDPYFEIADSAGGLAPNLDNMYLGAAIRFATVRDGAGKVILNQFKLVNEAGGFVNITSTGTATIARTHLLTSLEGPQHPHFPIKLTSGSVLTVWDFYLPQSTKDALPSWPGHDDFKFKFSQHQNPPGGKWFEQRTRWWRTADLTKIAAFDTRLYDFGSVLENAWCLKNVVSLQAKNDSTGLGSMPNPGPGSFQIPVGQWVRMWMLTELGKDAATDFTSWRTAVEDSTCPAGVTATGTWDRISVWLATETTGPTRVLYQAPARDQSTQTPPETEIVSDFFIELDTSDNDVVRRGNFTMYTRNVILKLNPTVDDTGCPGACTSPVFKNPVR